MCSLSCCKLRVVNGGKSETNRIKADGFEAEAVCPLRLNSSKPARFCPIFLQKVVFHVAFFSFLDSNCVKRCYVSFFFQFYCKLDKNRSFEATRWRIAIAKYIFDLQKSFPFPIRNIRSDRFIPIRKRKVSSLQRRIKNRSKIRKVWLLFSTTR